MPLYQGNRYHTSVLVSGNSRYFTTVKVKLNYQSTTLPHPADAVTKRLGGGGGGGGGDTDWLTANTDSHRVLKIGLTMRTYIHTHTTHKLTHTHTHTHTHTPTLTTPTLTQTHTHTHTNTRHTRHITHTHTHNKEATVIQCPHPSKWSVIPTWGCQHLLKVRVRIIQTVEATKTRKTISIVYSWTLTMAKTAVSLTRTLFIYEYHFGAIVPGLEI